GRNASDSRPHINVKSNDIDALVMRGYDEDTDDNPVEQYDLYDASFSVIALLDDEGDALERYRYTPYGKRIVMEPDFDEIASTAYNQHRGFQGLLHDQESGLIE